MAGRVGPELEAGLVPLESQLSLLHKQIIRSVKQELPRNSEMINWTFLPAGGQRGGFIMWRMGKREGVWSFACTNKNG